jgi:hypothetical protein
MSVHTPNSGLGGAQAQLGKERRREDRVKGIFPVRLLGTDADGKPYQELAHTLDVTPSSARLGSVRRELRVGERVTVQYRQEKVDFRVAWVRRLEGTKEYQVGLEAVIPARDAWGLQVPSAIAFKKGHHRANSSYSEMMGTIRCDICGSEFLLGHRAGCADPSAAEKQALWLEKLFADQHRHKQVHAHKIELPSDLSIPSR